MASLGKRSRTSCQRLSCIFWWVVFLTIVDAESLRRVQVNFSREAIQQRLVTSLYKPDLFEDLLFEDEALVTERARVKALLDAYKEAFKILSEVSLKSS